MISYERQNEILELLKERRTVTVEFLCRRLFASGATVRRDLAEMAQKGLLERVRGSHINQRRQPGCPAAGSHPKGSGKEKDSGRACLGLFRG